MKKLLVLIVTFLCSFTFVACSAGAAAESFSTPWANGEIFEQSVYTATREKVGGVRGNYTYDTVAKGTQTVTLQEGTEKDTIEYIVSREVEYIKDDVISAETTIAKGKKMTYYNKIVFSSAPATLLNVLRAEKKIVNEADPSVDMDYTATYSAKSGLVITTKEDVKSFKANKVKGMYDSDMWMLLIRYSEKFGKGWAKNFKFVSIADTLLYNKLSILNMTATAGSESHPMTLTAMDENIVLGVNDSFATESTDVPGTYYAPALDLTLAQPGDMVGSTKGPTLEMSFISDRGMNKLPLANLLLEYRQNEYTAAGTYLYCNRISLSDARIRPVQ